MEMKSLKFRSGNLPRSDSAKSGVDPGFPVGWGANIRFCQICQKLHEIEKILGPKQGGT